MQETSWVLLVKETFPEWATLPATCAIPLGIDVNQDDFGDVIDAVTAGGDRDALKRRLRVTHPVGRDHHEEFDRRFWNVFVEAEAFAWASEVAALGTPRFIEAEGAPDLFVNDIWIEAKTIEESQAERAEVDRLYKETGNGFVFRGPRLIAEPGPEVVKKFDAQALDGIRKLSRQQTGKLVMFYDLRYVDFGIRKDSVIEQVSEWAAGRSKHSDIAIVVCFNHRWRDPFVRVGI